MRTGQLHAHFNQKFYTTAGFTQWFVVIRCIIYAMVTVPIMSVVHWCVREQVVSTNPRAARLCWDVDNIAIHVWG